MGGFQGCYPDNHRNNWRCARAVRKRPQGHHGVPYGTGSCTYCACIANVAFLSMFHFYFIVSTTYRKKKITRPYHKNENLQIFFIIHTTYRQKKITRIYRKKKITRLDDFLCTRLTFFTILCYIGRVPTNFSPHRVLGALWTQCPIVDVAMGCHTESAVVHFVHVLQKLHFFQFFNFSVINLHHLPQKKITRVYRKKNFYFLIIYTTYRKKKLHAFTTKTNYTT